MAQTVKQVNFIMGTRSIEVSSWDKGMQELGVSKDIADRLRSRHMRKLLEEHEYVLQSWGGTVCLLITMNNRNSIRSPGLRRTTLTGERVKHADKMQN